MILMSLFMLLNVHLYSTFLNIIYYVIYFNFMAYYNFIISITVQKFRVNIIFFRIM